MRVAPGRMSLWLLAGGGLLALAAFAAAGVLALGLGALVDYGLSRRAWRQADARLTRRLPPAFAIGVARQVPVSVELQGTRSWTGSFYDHFDPTVVAAGVPLPVTLPASKRVELAYTITPTRRGEITFAPAELRLASRWRLCELFVRLGATELRRVYPD